MKRKRGNLNVVGLGPGNAAWLTQEAVETIERAQVLLGYDFYLEMARRLIKLRPDVRLLPSGNRVEIDRARQAIDLAISGCEVSLVSGGDAGVFGMAAPVWEVIDSLPPVERDRINVKIVPGISAAQAVAARIGAPIGHDYCVMSLSDIRKPRDLILRRVALALEGEFVLVIYNPASDSRRELLEQAIELCKSRRDGDTPVAMVSDAGRSGETIDLARLGSLDLARVNMRTLVIVGSSQSRYVEFAGRLAFLSPRSWELTS